MRLCIFGKGVDNDATTRSLSAGTLEKPIPFGQNKRNALQLWMVVEPRCRLKLDRKMLPFLPPNCKMWTDNLECELLLQPKVVEETVLKIPMSTNGNKKPRGLATLCGQ